jgi:hypothetical protein
MSARSMRASHPWQTPGEVDAVAAHAALCVCHMDAATDEVWVGHQTETLRVSDAQAVAVASVEIEHTPRPWSRADLVDYHDVD